jgi:TctA family transporter
VKRYFLMPAVLAFCIIGAFAVENTLIAILTMLGLGIVAYIMEANDYPIAPAILGLVLGPMLEETFLNSLIRARGDLSAFVSRPLSLGLALLALAICCVPLVLMLWRRLRPRGTSPA